MYFVNKITKEYIQLQDMKWEQLGDIPTVLLDECGSSHEYINQQIRSPNQVNMDQTHNHPATSGLVDLERCLQHVASSCSDEASLKKWATKTDARQRERRNVKKKKRNLEREISLENRGEASTTVDDDESTDYSAACSSSCSTFPGPLLRAKKIFSRWPLVQILV